MNKTTKIIVGVAALLGIVYLVKKSKKDTIAAPEEVGGNDTQTRTSDFAGNTIIAMIPRAGSGGNKTIIAMPVGNRNVKYGCKDGTISNTIKGCKGHGGAEWVQTY